MTKYLRISSYIRKPFLIYDFATAKFPNIRGKFYFIFYQYGRKKELVLPTSAGENAAHFFEKPVMGARPSSLLPPGVPPAPGRLHVLVDRERELNLHLLIFALAAQPSTQDSHRSLS
jgi:hypothetical protein